MSKKKIKAKPKAKAKAKIKVISKKRKTSKQVKSAIKNRLSELLDKRLLEIATKQYSRVMREVARGRKRLDAETKTALQVGERIIAKAKEVKETLVRK